MNLLSQPATPLKRVGLCLAMLAAAYGLLTSAPLAGAPRRLELPRGQGSSRGRAAPPPSAPAKPASQPEATAPPGRSDRAPTIAQRERTAESAARGAPSFAERKKPLDPIATNGSFFDGWPKPDAALVLTGRLEGYLEPCGCAGVENQKGGLSRRYSMMEQLRQKGWPVAGIDLGGLVRRFGPQGEIQLDVASSALEQMGYIAVGLGAEDLRLPDTTLLNITSQRPIFVAGNYTVLDPDLSPPPFRIQQVGALKVGVTQIVSAEYQKRAQATQIAFVEPETAIRKVLPDLESCDVRLLMAYATSEETAELAKQFPAFQFVVSAGGGDEPPPKWQRIPGSDSKTRLIEVGHKGMFAVVLGFFNDEKTPVRYQRVALDSRYADAPAMLQLKAEYQQHLQHLGWEGLGINRRPPVPRAKPGVRDGAKFTGSQVCADCHQAEYDIWAASGHARATETLIRLKPPQQFDPECISCHATGWAPQEFIPYASGFDSMETTPQLAGNGCENCHGPGAAHVEAENGDDAKLQAKLRKAMVAEKSDLACIVCHDGDNSPQFTEIGFARYWAEIEHGRHAKGKQN